MNILYVSTLSSRRLLGRLYARYGITAFAVQKFHRLVATGLVKNDVRVRSLSSPPYKPNQGPKWVHEHSEEEDGVAYKYTLFLNIAGVRHAMVMIYSFFYVLFWGLTRRKRKAIVCDVLNISICMGALLASKIVRVKSIGVVTDMPGLMVGSDNNKKRSLLSRFITWTNKSYLSHFSSYVFLTAQMNAPINTRHRPYIIMEGLVDSSVSVNDDSQQEKASPRTILYAGGLYARYGLKMLCDAFTTLPQQDVRLLLYGSGTFVEELQNDYCQRDKRIRYMGVRPNEEVVQEELRATLLVNPRPTTEAFTQYSFPSKNMEYMLSGTPLLTTKLPGMPTEYYPHVYLFEEETIAGYTKALNGVLSLSEEDLQRKGYGAQKFVLAQKNNITQTKRILKLI